MNRPLARVLSPAVLAVAVCLILVGCGSESGDVVPSSEPPAGTTAAVSNDTAGVTVSGELGSKPTVSIGSQTKDVTTLVAVDLVEGTGATVAADATITAHYVGVGAISGQEFDSSWSRGEPTQFPLSRVIEGWSQGIPGMKIGGRRLLVIPGSMAYGSNPPQGSGIASDEALVFVVDVVSSP